MSLHYNWTWLDGATVVKVCQNLFLIKTFYGGTWDFQIHTQTHAHTYTCTNNLLAMAYGLRPKQTGMAWILLNHLTLIIPTLALFFGLVYTPWFSLHSIKPNIDTSLTQSEFRMPAYNENNHEQEHIYYKLEITWHFLQLRSWNSFPDIPYMERCAFMGK